MSTTVTERQPLPPIQCAPWCVEGDGHPDPVHPDDQVCEAGFIEIDLSLEDPQHDIDDPTAMQIFFAKRPRDPAPHFEVNIDGRAPVEMTQSEMETFVEKVAALLDQVKAATTLLTATEAAAMLRVPLPTLVDWQNFPGKGPDYVMLGQCMMFRLSVLTAWIDAR